MVKIVGGLLVLGYCVGLGLDVLLVFFVSPVWVVQHV